MAFTKHLLIFKPKIMKAFKKNLAQLTVPFQFLRIVIYVSLACRTFPQSMNGWGCRTSISCHNRRPFGVMGHSRVYPHCRYANQVC